MNSIVRSWNRTVIRQSVPDAPDVLVLEDEKVLPQEEIVTGGKTMVQELRKVSINKGAVQEFALYGPQDRVEALFRETHRTLQRLGLKADGAKALTKSPRFQGGRPSVHDIKRWLDDLRVPGNTEGAEVTAALKKDLNWLKRLHLTVKGRSHTDVVKKTEAESA